MEVVAAVKKIADKNRDNKNKKILTVGCSVGRIPLELGKFF